jgi:hypothetical protein
MLLTPGDQPMTARPPSSINTLGAMLERDRLERRARRMTVVIAGLRQQASGYAREAAADSKYLHHAIAEFEAEIETMNARLRELVPPSEAGYA